MEIQYIILVTVPDEIDPEVMAAVEEDAEPHDKTLADKIMRHIGGHIDRAERDLGGEMYEGWRVWIMSGDPVKR